MRNLRSLALLASPARRNPQWFGARRDVVSVRDRRMSSAAPLPIPKLKEVRPSIRTRNFQAGSQLALFLLFPSDSGWRADGKGSPQVNSPVGETAPGTSRHV